MNAHEQMVEALAADMEHQLNTGHRVFVVDRAALSRTYAALGRLVGVDLAPIENHDPGDEDRS